MKNWIFTFAIITTLAACKETPKTEETTAENTTTNSTTTSTTAENTTATSSTTATVAPAASMTDTAIGVQGATPAKVRFENGEKVYVYGDVSVFVRPEPNDAPGDYIRVMRKSDGDKVLTSIKGFGFFNGVAGDYLFVDEGTSDVGRTMHAYELITGKKAGAFRYDSDEVSFENEQVRYYVLLEDKVADQLPMKPVCPDADEIKKNGLSMGYMEQYIFNLKTKMTTMTKSYKCRALQ